MERLLKYYYEEKKVSKPVARILMAGFERNPDIAHEFCKWIENRSYDYDDPLIVNGYTANRIHEIAPHLDASGVYGFLVTLREKPDVAEETIKNNFARK